MRGTRFEVSTTGPDSALQGVWSDPYGGAYQTGLLIPQVLPTARDYKHRLTFLLCRASFAAGCHVRLVGLRQLLTVAAVVPNAEAGDSYILEKPIPADDPTWHFTDATVSWHVMRVPHGSRPLPNPANRDGTAFRYTTTPALLFEANPGLASYVPPYAGRPLGVPVAGHLGNMHDIRYPWNDNHAWDALDVEVAGPCDVVFYASVQQTNAETRAKLLPPASTDGFPTMDAFIANFDFSSVPFIPTTYWRIAGAMVFEVANMQPMPRDLIEDDVNPWCIPDRQAGGQTEGAIEPSPGRLPPGGKWGGDRGVGKNGKKSKR